MGNDGVAFVMTVAGALIAPGTLSSVADCTALTAQLEGMFGLTTLPLKLTKPIIAKEYMEMYKILSKSWHLKAEAIPPVGQGNHPQRGPITDISV